MIRVRWRRASNIGLIVFSLGISLLLEIPVIQHAESVLIVEYGVLIIFVSIGASVGLALSSILLTNYLYTRIKREIRPILICLLSTLVVASVYYAMYFIPFLSHVEIPSEFGIVGLTDPTVQYVVVQNLAILFLVLFTLYLNRRSV
ncbi:MAG: hypothetical protein ACTSR0_00105 [Candidatus Asgardarchaeia archaeon]